MRSTLALLRVVLFLLGALAAGAGWAAPQLLTLEPRVAGASTAPQGHDVLSRGRRAHFNADAMFALPRGAEVELALPDGSRHPFVLDLQQPQGGGVRSWIGHHRDLGRDYRAIVTSGPAGTFAVFTTPKGEWRLVPGPGGDVLVDMESERANLPPVDVGHDVVTPPTPKRTPVTGTPPQPYMPIPGVNTVASAKAAPLPIYDVDLMVVYTAGVEARLGPNLLTRLQFLVTHANVVYADSEIGINLRLVHTMKVDYPDTTSDAAALSAISPDCSVCSPVSFDPVHFGDVENQRTAAGADLVMLLRDTGDFGGSGLAYFGFNPPAPHWMYSVVSGCLLGCDWVFVHELGHNMGLQHDRATASWQAGGTPTPSSGIFSYSFGYAFCSSGALSCNPEIPPASGGCSAEPNCSTSGAGNFADVMAYFHSSYKAYRISNPDIPCTGLDGTSQPCGVPAGQPKEANGALSINNYRAALSAAVSTAAPGVFPGTIEFPATNVGAIAAGGTATVTVRRALGTGGAVQVSYRTVDGSAVAGTDYTAASGTLTWADGDGDDKVIAIALAPNATKSKTFSVELFDLVAPVGAGLQQPARATVLVAAPWPENGAFPAGFTTGGFPSSTDWTAATDSAFEGTTSVRSPQVLGQPNNSFGSANLTFQGDFVAGTIAFAYRASDFGDPYANFEFFVDGSSVLRTGGETGWQVFSTPVAAGHHVLVWSSINQLATPCGAMPDAPGGAGCADRFWIDAVALPLASAAQIASMSLLASPNPSLVGGTVTLRATVAGPSGTPTGTVAFSDGIAGIAGCAAVPLVNGAATCMTSALSQGSHVLQAAYSGDATYIAATSPGISQLVRAAAAVSLASVPNPSLAGQNVTFTANVTGTSGVPTGQVRFLDNDAVLCAPVTLANGVATCTTTTLAVGTHQIMAVYLGGTVYANAASSVLLHVVSTPAKADPVVTLASTPNPATLAQAVAFTASVSGTAGAATGTVAFFSDGAGIAGCASVPLASGIAACNTAALAVGTHAIAAQYSGDTAYNAAMSQALTQSVAAPPPTMADVSIAMAASLGHVAAGQDVTFTLTVGNAGPAAATSVVVTDTLPADVTVAALSTGCAQTGGAVTCNVGTLAAGASVQLALALTTRAAGTLSNAATVAAGAPDPASANNTASASVTVDPVPTGSVVNLSTRGDVGTGNDVLIGGFVIGGATPKTVVVTAIGPSLAQAGIANPLANPTLTLVRSTDQAIIATNDDWAAAANAAQVQAAGLAPANAKESAILMTLPPGAYTAIVADANGGTGVGIVAVYEVDHPETPLANISTRGQVGTGGSVMIAGFVIQGSAPRTVAVTGTGPSLAAAGIANPLANPALTLVRSADQSIIASNDDWGTAANAAQLQAAGLAPADAREPAILVTLPPGAYTAILSGAQGGTGVGIVAVYSR